MNLLTSDKPDIFDIGTYDVMKSNKLYPLDNMGINKSTFPVNKLLQYKNKSVAVNVSGNVVKFVWNKDIFKKCGLDPEKGPKTWQEVMDYSKIIKAKMPEVIPFEAPFAGYNEFKRSIGEPSVNSDTIHTTFWNYKKGVYDYSSAKYILNFYREMYADDLMSKDLEKSDRNMVRLDFYNGKTAMINSIYDDKIKFLSINPLSFPIGISNLPKINLNDTQKYFFVDDVSRIAVNAKSGAKPEVRKAFEWYAKTCIDATKVTPYKFKSKFFPELNGYDNIDNFRFEDKDPTPALSFGYQPIKDLIYSCIRGQESTEVTISELNKFLNDYCKDIKSQDKNFFNSFIGEE
jgi:multiple sugar transport system substrate-binding protein